ncbi:hypothetical protein ACYUS6_13485, partial [Escherichia coli]
DGDGSHGSTSKTPSYTKSVSWHHYRIRDDLPAALNPVNNVKLDRDKNTSSKHLKPFIFI